MELRMEGRVCWRSFIKPKNIHQKVNKRMEKRITMGKVSRSNPYRIQIEFNSMTWSFLQLVVLA